MKLNDERAFQMLDWARDDVKSSETYCLKNGILSWLIREQMINHTAGLGETLAGVHHVFHCNHIFQAISALEKTSPADPTKPAEKFSAGALKGLWHKHFRVNTMSSFAQNLRKETDANFDKLFYGTFVPRLSKFSGEGPVSFSKTAGLLAHTMVIDGYLNRNGAAGKNPSPNRMTGEWIVFAKLPNQNVYLTLATHAEKRDNAESILARCRPLVCEFPELAEIPGIKSTK